MISDNNTSTSNGEKNNIPISKDTQQSTIKNEAMTINTLLTSVKISNKEPSQQVTIENSPDVILDNYDPRVMRELLSTGSQKSTSGVLKESAQTNNNITIPEDVRLAGNIVKNFFH